MYRSCNAKQRALRTLYYEELLVGILDIMDKMIC